MRNFTGVLKTNQINYEFKQVDKMLAEDISKLMLMIPQEEMTARKEGTDRIEGGAFDGVMDKATPFMYKVCIK